MLQACTPERYTFYTAVVKYLLAPVVLFALGHWHGRVRERQNNSKQG